MYLSNDIDDFFEKRTALEKNCLYLKNKKLVRLISQCLETKLKHRRIGTPILPSWHSCDSYQQKKKKILKLPEGKLEIIKMAILGDFEKKIDDFKKC